MQVAHAFMAAEALTPVARHHLQKELGLSDDDFYQEAKKDGKIKYSMRQNDKPNTNNHFARRRVVFGGDRETHKAAREVSDGFEHGFETYEKLLEKAEKCAEPTMAHVRRAIINLSPLADRHKAVLLDDERFRKPLAIYSGRFLTGTVSGVPSGGNDEWNDPVDLSEQVVKIEYDAVSGKYSYPLNLNLKSNRDGVEVTAHIDT